MGASKQQNREGKDTDMAVIISQVVGEALALLSAWIYFTIRNRNRGH